MLIIRIKRQESKRAMRPVGGGINGAAKYFMLGNLRKGDSNSYA